MNIKQLTKGRKPILLLSALLFTLVLSGCTGVESTITDDSVLTKSYENSPITVSKNTAKIAKVSQKSYLVGSIQDYTANAYHQALADGKTVFLDFHANWCSVCANNKPKIKSAIESSEGIVGFQVNYDKEKQLKKDLSVSSHSTLVILNENGEIKRTMGPQTERGLALFLDI